MTRPKKIKDAIRVSVILPKAQAERVKQMAIQMSSQEGRVITTCEAMRMAIETVYPIPKQMSLF